MLWGRRRVRGAASCAVLALAACGGGGGASVAPATPAVALGTAQFALTIPNRIAMSSERRTQYISPSTLSAKFVANPGAITTKINLTSSICVPNAQATARICTFTAGAPVGMATFAMTTYDQDFDGSGSLPGGTNALSAASNFVVMIAEGMNNPTVPLIAGGIPTQIDLQFAGTGGTSAVVAGSGSTSVAINVYDADGNIIVAPGAFVNASGAATPLTITSSAATGYFGYTVTPASTGIAGARSSTITLNEPDDAVAVSYTGIGFVPGTDTLTHTAVTNHTGGGTTTAFAYGWLPSTPFNAKIMVPLSTAEVTAIGHNGVFVTDGNSSVGFVGDTTSSCNVHESESPYGNVGAIGGMTADPGISDDYLYFNVTDATISPDEGIDQIPMSGVIGSNCTLSNQAVPTSGGTPAGIAASNGSLYGGATSVDFILTEAVPVANSVSSAVTGGGAFFGIQAVGVSPDGTRGYLQVGAKKAIGSFTFNSSGTVNGQTGLAGMTDPYPAGMTVDTGGNVYANDTNSVTFGTAGGVVMMGPSLGTFNGKAQLNAAISQGGMAGALQNMAVGTYHGNGALFVLCGDGIEVFAAPLTGTETPTATLTLPYGTPIGIVANNDGRMWVLMSNGKIEALPPV